MENLVNSILSFYDSDESNICFYQDAVEEWSKVHDTHPDLLFIQKLWDRIKINKISSSFNFAADKDSAQDFASKRKESNSWLNLLPSKTLGTVLDNNTFRISVALRFGLDLCAPHQCNCNNTLVEMEFTDLPVYTVVVPVRMVLI